MQSNITKLEFQRNICQALSQHMPQSISGDKLLASAWRVHDFSSVFRIRLKKNVSEPGYYAKVAKDCVEYQGIIPQNQASRDLGSAEYDALIYLNKNFNQPDSSIKFVEPVAYLDEQNCLITNEAMGQDFLIELRTYGVFKYILRKKKRERIERAFSELGMLLKSYSIVANRKNKQLSDTSHLRGKITKHIAGLTSHGVEVSEHCLQKKIEEVATVPISLNLINGFKGFDVRNLVIDEDGGIKILDAGKLKREFDMDLVARFLVTCDLIYWGSVLFFLKKKCPSGLVSAFLDGYGTTSDDEKRYLKASLIKEYTKHWHLAHTALSIKKWPKLLSLFFHHFYINPFYKRALENLSEDKA